MSTLARKPQRRRSRRRRESSPLAIAAKGVAILAVMGMVGYFALVSSSGPPLLGFKTQYAVVPDPGNLRPHNAVRVAGVRVGQVIDVESRNQGGARVKFKLDPGSRPLPRDSTVVVRAQGLLGARFLEVVPGNSPETLSEGATLRGGKDSLTFGVPDALDTFDAETRGALGDMLRDLGRGFAGRGQDLNELIAELPEAATQFQALSSAILGRSGAARRLVPSLDRLATALDLARDDLAAMLDPTARGLRPFVDQRAALQGTLDAAPGALRAANAGLADGRVLLTGASALASAATDTLRPAPRGLRATATLLRASRTPLKRTAGLLEDVRPTVPAVLRITRALAPQLGQLQSGAGDAIPILRQLGVHGCDVENMADNWRSILNIGVPGGGLLGGLTSFRIAAMGGAAITGVGDTVEPLMVDDFRKEIYPPACKYSPGPRYDIGSARQRGGRSR